MSAGTFSLMPGPPTPGVDAGPNFAGTVGAGVLSGFTAVTSLYYDTASRVKGAPIAVVQDAYMRACRDFCRLTEWLKRNITDTALTINQPTYNFGADPALEVIGVHAAMIQQQNLTWVGLRPMDQAQADPNMKSDLPNWYSYLPEGMIVYYPAPNLAYLARVELIVQTALAAVQVPNDLVNRFNLYLEAGALWHLYLMDKEPWFNPILAKQAEDRFNEGVANARSMKDRGNQRGSVRATPRPFVSR